MKYRLLLSIILLCLFPALTLACSRFEFGVPIAAKFTRANAVFVGKTISVESLTGKADYPNNWLKVRFRVQLGFKGSKNSTITLITNDWRAACGLKIRKVRLKQGNHDYSFFEVLKEPPAIQ